MNTSELREDSAKRPSAEENLHSLPPTLPNGRAWPKISIVTPSFNQGRYIEQTILSVASQGYPSVEHIVIDGGSTDETQEILKHHRRHLAHVVSESDNGQTHALNRGFARATGNILTWLNSDDMLAPGALAAVAMAFHSSGADIVAGMCQLHRDDKPIEQHLTSCRDGPLPLDDLLDLDRCWLTGQFFYQPEVMFTRGIWERAGGRLDETWTYSMDYELWLRFAEHGARLHVIGRPVALFRVHPEQKTSAPEKFQAELVKVRDAFLQRTGRAVVTRNPLHNTRDRLRMVFFNDIGPKGGAGLAHGRLAQACAWAGHRVFPVAVSEHGVSGNVEPPSAAAILSEIEECRPDVVVAGNLHGAALDPGVLGLIAERWPTLWVLHDQWALTGRCAYTGDCDKYLNGCDHTCPTPNEYPELEPAKVQQAWIAKRRILGTVHPPVLLANSRWMLDFARRTLATQERAELTQEGRSPVVEPIRLGFPLDVFRPRDRRVCRDLLDLPQDPFIIMTSGSCLADPRKGVTHLAAALEYLRLPDLLVVGVGTVEDDQPVPSRGMRMMGYMDRPERLALLYSAADLFVGPSLQEAFGQVFVEAAACGTPSIGYPVGGVPEAIADGITGRLAAAVSPDALAEAIRELYSDAELRANMRVWARLHVENEWSLAAAYQRWFTALGRVGLRDKLGLVPKISFSPYRPTPRPTQYADAVYAEWKEIRGHEAKVAPGRGPQTVFPVCDTYPHALCQDEGRMRAAYPAIKSPTYVPRHEKMRRITETLETLAEQGIRRVALYGAGQHTLDVIPALNEAPVEICGIVDDCGPGRLAGWRVVAPDDVASLDVEAVVLSSDQFEESMWSKRAIFESKGIRVLRLYASEESGQALAQSTHKVSPVKAETYGPSIRCVRTDTSVSNDRSTCSALTQEELSAPSRGKRFPVASKGIHGGRRVTRCSIIVHQMGKVGSEAIVANLKSSLVSTVYHTHMLNIKYYDPNRNTMQIKAAQECLRDIVRPQNPAKFITPVREPIGVIISSFFQNFERHMGHPFSQSDKCPASIARTIQTLFTQLGVFPITWFDRHVRDVLGIDVYAAPFPESGYATYANGPFEMLVFKSELPDEIKERIIRSFVRLDSFRIVRKNVSAEKDYGKAYQRLRDDLYLPTAHVDMMLESKYVRHFYTEQEIRDFRAFWLSPNRTLSADMGSSESRRKTNSVESLSSSGCPCCKSG